SPSATDQRPGGPYGPAPQRGQRGSEIHVHAHLGFCLVGPRDVRGLAVRCQATVSERSALWMRVDEATHDPAGPVKLQAIETGNPGTLPARAAGFQRARWNLQQGLESLAGDDHVRALPLLTEARTLYTQLVPH